MTTSIDTISPQPQSRNLTLIAVGIAIAVGVVMAQLEMINPIAAMLLPVIIAGFIIALDPWKGLVLLLIATQFNGFRFDSGPYTLRPEQLVLVLVFIGGLAHFLRGKSRLHATVLDLPIFGLLITGFVSSFLYSINRAHSYQSLVLQIVYVAMYFFTVNVLLNNRTKLETTVKIMMALAVAHMAYALVAFVSFLAGVDIGGISSAHLLSLGYPSTSGLFQEANLLGAYAASMAVLFAVHLVTPGDERFVRPKFLAIGLILLLVVILTSMTRSSWIGMLVTISALIFYSRPRWNVINPKGVAFIGFLLVALLAFFPVINYVFSEASGKEDALLSRVQDIVNFESGSGGGRVQTQELALERWRERPVLGNGVLTLPQSEEGVLGEEAQGWIYSTLLQNLHDTGLVGAFFTLWIHIVPIAYALWASRVADDPVRKASLVGLGLGALVMAISSQASSFFWLGFPWVYLGILVALSKDTLEQAEEKASEELRAA